MRYKLSAQRRRHLALPNIHENAGEPSYKRPHLLEVKEKSGQTEKALMTYCEVDNIVLSTNATDNGISKTYAEVTT